jgi:hypothetical protein
MVLTLVHAQSDNLAKQFLEIIIPEAFDQFTNAPIKNCTPSVHEKINS